ncbi:MAG: DNA gyrase inhibitor YacG [Rhodospirillales bacterium]
MARKSGPAAEVVPLKTYKCPTCGRPARERYRPFCSQRCADLDLGRWLNEDYRIPTDEAPGEAFQGEPDEADDGGSER